MIVLAAQTLRGRWPVFVGTLIALALGVLLAASSGMLLTDPALSEMGSLFGTMAGIALFAAIFVVAGTCAFAVDQRRSELALLRAVGATPGQIRQLIVGETLLVGLVGSVIGCALGPLAARLMVAALVSVGWVAPGASVHASALGLVLPVGLGVVVARLAVGPASRRAARACPVEAVRGVTVEGRVMTCWRWVNGVFWLATGIAMLVAAAAGTGMTTIGLSAMVAEVLVIGLSALAPVFVPAALRLVGTPLSWVTRASGGLAVANLRAGVRLSASTAAPALVTVAIIGSMVGLVDTAIASTEQSYRHGLLASVVVGAGGEETLPPDTAERIATVDGVAAVVPVRTTPAQVTVTAIGRDDEDTKEVDTTAAAMDPAELAQVVRVLTRTGDLADLTGDGVAVSAVNAADWNLAVGDELLVAGDALEPVRSRVVAVVDLPDLLPGLLVPGDWGTRWSAAETLVATCPGADPVTVVAGTRAVLGSDTPVRTTADWITDWRAETDRQNLIALIVLLGMSIVYTVIAVANTQMMAATERATTIALLRRTGATPGQTLRVVVCEAALGSGIGAALGAVVALVSVVGVGAGLSDVNHWAVLVLPWQALALSVAGCLAVAVTSAVLSTLPRTLRA